MAVKPKKKIKLRARRSNKAGRRAARKRKPIKPEKAEGMGIISVFGNRIKPSRIEKSVKDAYRKKEYTTDDIHLPEFIRDKTDHNLMVKIGILDHIEEMAAQMYPSLNVYRKNKITLVLE
ncbi:MAG: hypothetical protein V1921_00165 [Candidatus Altiarchaeota archaeon]